MKLNYKSFGEGDPIIILHGIFGSSDNWFSVAKILAENNKIYLLDQRNHGDSFHDEEFTYDAMVGDLKRFIEEEAIKDPIVIGHSMGGKVAMKFGVNYPELFEKLIIVDISPRAYPTHHQNILKGLMSIDLEHLGSRKDADDQLARHISEKGVRQFLLKNLSRDDQNSFKWKINLPVIEREIENVGEGLDEHLACDKPTLFIRGANSDYIRNDDNIAIVSIFPNSEVVTIPDAGHWIHAEKPDEFIKAVTNFIRN